MAPLASASAPHPPEPGPKPQPQPFDIPPQGSFTAAGALEASSSSRGHSQGEAQVEAAKCHQASPTGQRRWLHRGLRSWQGL